MKESIIFGVAWWFLVLRTTNNIKDYKPIETLQEIAVQFRSAPMGDKNDPKLV